MAENTAPKPDLATLEGLTAEARKLGPEFLGLMERTARVWLVQPELGAKVLAFYERQIAALSALTGKVN